MSHGRAVVLLNFGGPETLEQVEEFIFQILSDPDTLQLPFPGWLQNRLARKIARRRAPDVREQYRAIGGGSPLVAATAQLAKSLETELRARGHALPLFTAHRYLPGWTTQTAQALTQQGVEHLLMIPLYPHYSRTTTGSSLKQLTQALAGAGWRGQAAAVDHYPDAPRYLEALGGRLKSTLSAEGLGSQDTLILCSAHGLPASYVRRGDPYRQDLERTVAGLEGAFPGWRFRLSFQSRVGPMEWLRPYTDEEIPRLAGEGFRHVVFLPLAFVNDHLETLHEIGHTYFELARRHGLTPHRVPAVEDHPAFVAQLADFVEAWGRHHLSDPPQKFLPPGQWLRRNGLWLAAVGVGLLGSTFIF